MKNLIKLLLLLTVVSFILISCEGPMGPAGNDGLNGADGKDANTACLKCHTMANSETKLAEYHLSKHFVGTTSARNTKYCASATPTKDFLRLPEQENLSYQTTFLMQQGLPV